MKCWYCKKATMEEAPDLGKGWSRCPKCGATHIEPLKLGVYALGEIWHDEAGEGHYSSKPHAYR